MAPSTDSQDECASLCSYNSSRIEEEEEGPSVEDTLTEDDFEEKLLQAMDSTFLKAVKARVAGLEAIRRAFASRYVVDFINERRCSISDILERCIKKGKGEEQGSAALLTALVCISLGPGESTDAIFADLEAHMVNVLMDQTVSSSIRGRFATALGICSFIAGVGPENIDRLMECFHSIFCASFLKSERIALTVGTDTTAFHSAALLSWALLLTIQNVSDVARVSEKHLPQLIRLLDSSDVELRIAVGETIAVLYEICHDYRPELFVDPVLSEKLRQLATDSQKFRAKKDRRKQRSSFRDVLKYLEEEELPSVTVKFGRERVFIDTWCRKIQYDAFCHILGSGMNRHLTENELLRDIFELGPPLPVDIPTKKASKLEKRMENMAASKARTRSRGKLRDKRADVVS